MEEKKNQNEIESVTSEEEGAEIAAPSGESAAVLTDSEKPLDKNVRLLSPTRMVLRRFFRSKLSIIGLIMIVALLLFLERMDTKETERERIKDIVNKIIEQGDSITRKIKEDISKMS